MNAAMAKRRFVLPGEIGTTSMGDELITILGSCVALVLWHADTGFGAMSHIVLPQRMPSDRSRAVPGRYAPEAVDALTGVARQRGLHLADFRLCLFGGSSLQQTGGQCRDVGCRNIAAVRDLVAARAAVIVRADLGGNLARRVVLDAESGAVSVTAAPVGVLEAAAG